MDARAVRDALAEATGLSWAVQRREPVRTDPVRSEEVVVTRVDYDAAPDRVGGRMPILELEPIPTCTERIIYVRRCAWANDAFPGTSPLFPKRTVAAGWARLHEWAAEAPGVGHWVLDIGVGTFALPVTSEGTTKALESVDLAHLTVRGKGSDRTTLEGPGGGATWAVIFKESRDLTVSGFRLTYTGIPPMESSGIDLQSVRYARLIDLVLDPISFWGVRCIGLGGGEVPSPGACEDVHVHGCTFVGPMVNPGNPNPEALLVADTTRVHIASCHFVGIQEVGVGLWRAVIDADVEGCTFEGPGHGARVGRTTSDVRFVDCTFTCANGIQAALDPDHVSNAPYATLVTVDRCHFTDPQPGTGSGITLYACDGVTIRGSGFVGLNNGVVLGDNADHPPPRNVRIETCVFEGPPLSEAWHLRSDILVQKHGLEPCGHVIAECCFRNAVHTHAALTLVSGLTATADSDPPTLAAQAWAALGIQLLDDNKMCHTGGDVTWKDSFRAIEITNADGVGTTFVFEPFAGSSECCPE